MTDKAVLDTAKRLSEGQGDEGIVTLSTGVVVRLKPVSSSLVEDMKLSIPMPDVPVVYIEAKDREEENPNDPAYIKAIEQAQRERADAVLDALVLFGVELLDGMPEDDSWLKKLLLLEKKGRIDLSDYDAEDDFSKEFLYKRYVAVAGADLSLIAGLHGFRPLEVARQRQMFLGNEERDTFGGARAEKLGEDGDRDEPSTD